MAEHLPGKTVDYNHRRLTTRAVFYKAEPSTKCTQNFKLNGF
jgi:hypothetical protein